MYIGVDGCGCVNDAAVFERAFCSFASLSAARFAYMFWCNETLPMCVACGKEDSAHERLGRDTSLSGDTPFLLD